MLNLLILAFIAYCAYKFFTTTDDENETTVPDTHAIKDAARKFKEDLAPVRDQVTQATTNAKKAYDDAQHQRRIDALLNDPQLLADALEARLATQKQLPSGE